MSKRITDADGNEVKSIVVSTYNANGDVIRRDTIEFGSDKRLVLPRGTRSISVIPTVELNI